LLQTGFFHLVYLRNSGSAFGLPASQTFLLIATSVAILLIVMLFSYYLFAHYRSPITTLSIVSLSLILGGAVGNLIERLRFGYVTDFIDIRLWGNFHWPAFNIADAAIVIGILTFVYSLYRSGLFKKVYEHERKVRK
jgi:signal peptidase II